MYQHLIIAFDKSLLESILFSFTVEGRKLNLWRAAPLYQQARIMPGEREELDLSSREVSAAPTAECTWPWSEVLKRRKLKVKTHF